MGAGNSTPTTEAERAKYLTKLATQPICAGKKYVAGWSVLKPEEKKSLETVVLALKLDVKRLEFMFVDFLFDSTHYDKYGDITRALNHEDFEQSRAPILTFFREIRANSAEQVMLMVNKHGTRVYNDIAGEPQPIPTVVGENVYQHVPAEFFRPDSRRAISVKMVDCSTETQKVIRDAIGLLKTGYLPCGDKVEDAMVTNLLDPMLLDYTIEYSHYLCAKGYLVQQQFHKALSMLVQNIDGVSFSPGPHKGNKRYMAKMFEYKNEADQEYETYVTTYIAANNGDPPPDDRERSMEAKPYYKAIKDTVRGSVVCSDHSTMHAAYTALMSSSLFQGRVTKDRRNNDSCRDVLQVVLFGEDLVPGGLLCEVQFHFQQCLPLKSFSHAAYNVKRLEETNLLPFRTIFEHPVHRCDTAKRSDVKCKLHF